MGTVATPLTTGTVVTYGADQRGFTRNVGTAVDIGAFEVQFAPSLPMTALPAAQVGQGYVQTIAVSPATGTGPSTLTFFVTGTLPPGLSVTLTPAKDRVVISGIPTAPGFVTITVTATDQIGVTATQSYPLTINAALGLTAPASTTFKVLQPVNQTIAAAGGTGAVTITYSISGELPSGLSITRTVPGGPLVITGTPTTSGFAVITVTATDQTGVTATTSYGITVNQAPTISAAVGPNGGLLVAAVSSAVALSISGVTVLSSGVRSASVAFGPSGQVVLVTYKSGILVRYDRSGARVLFAGGVQGASLAYGPLGEVLLVTTPAGALFRQIGGGALRVVTQAGVLGASLTFVGGSEVIVTTTTTGAVYRQTRTGTTLLAGSGTAYSATVTYGSTGQIVLAILLDGTVIQLDSLGLRRVGTVI